VPSRRVAVLLAAGVTAICALLACSSTDAGSSSAAPAEGASTPPVATGQDLGCGGTLPKKCEVGEGCKAGSDCASGVCTGETCAAPSPTDKVKNGDETDVDCGGSAPKKCAVGKACKVHADCTIAACREGVCAAGKSCRAVAGGATCGTGEVGAPGAKHEDCCSAIDVPRPAESGGPFRLDKYLITAGRMRAFLEDVKSDVKGFVAADPPPGWDETWTKSVPGNDAEVVMQLGIGQQGATSYGGKSVGPGCYVKGMGAPAYWLDKAQQESNGDIERAFTQAELDTKVLNCATRALFAAFCHWDGKGRLPTRDEWKFAVNGGDAKSTYPWGTELPIGKFASYNFNYSWPRALADGDLDRGAILPAPGRFPQGEGPFGHMDLAGAVETFTADGGVMQYSFQEAGKEQFNIVYGKERTWNPSTKHWAVGARCAR
jgi:formylglycine-generating enzyme required for sulfatase activity